MPESILRYRQTALCLALLWLGWAGALHAQILFEEHCYTGGVTVSGAGNSSWGLGRLAAVRWKPGYTYKHIYAVTHRFGRIAPPIPCL
jgi:hypothetical protein